MGKFGINSMIYKGIVEKNENVVRGVSKYISSITPEDVENIIEANKIENKSIIMKGGIK